MEMRDITLLIVAIIGCLFLITYLLRIPFVLFGSDIVNEYYQKHAFPNVWFDIIFVGIYLIVPLICRMHFKFSCVYGVLVAAITTVVLTGTICAIFRAIPHDSNNFFSRWFNKVGYGAVVYDTILIVVTLLAFEHLRRPCLDS